MEDLIKRLEAAEVGSRELDGAVWYAIHEPDVDHGCLHVEQTEQGPVEVLTCELGSKYADCVGNYTTSLESTIALAERVLPGWAWMVRHWPEDQGAGVAGWTAYVRETDRDLVDSGPVFSSAALALCIAILRAKLIDTASNPR